MSQHSVTAAAVTLLAQGVTALASVVIDENVGLSDLDVGGPLPAARLAQGQSRERLLDSGGDRESKWPLTVSVWARYPNAASEETFSALVESVAQWFRDNPHLGGAGDTDTSQLLWLFPDQVLPRLSDRKAFHVAGMPANIVRRGTVRVQVTEILRG